MNAEMTWCSKV